MGATKCSGCGTESLKHFLSFGKLPLGNAFLRSTEIENEKKFDLDLGFCSNCTLVQQMNPAPQSSLAEVYKNYRYVPVGNSLRNNLASLGRSIFDNFDLTADSFFVDIGSNDGALLQGIEKRCRALGIEPAAEISELARQKGIETITGFFSHEMAEKVVSGYGHADVVTATQVLQHITDLPQFMRDVRGLLKPKGIFVVEGRYFGDTVRKFSFDTVYHEMLSFFTLRSLMKLLELFGMQVFRAEPLDVYGGSLRVFAKNSENNDIAIEDSVARVLKDESSQGLDEFDTYLSFAKRVIELRDELHKLVVRFAQKGTIAGYGAPSTGTTLLNFCSLGNGYIKYVVDDSPLKQGLLTPGTHIPIVDSTFLITRPPDYLLLIAWRLRQEILSKLKNSKERFSVIVPLPKVEVFELDSDRQPVATTLTVQN